MFDSSIMRTPDLFDRPARPVTPRKRRGRPEKIMVGVFILGASVVALAARCAAVWGWSWL